MALRHVQVAPLPPTRFRELLTEPQQEQLDHTIHKSETLLAGRAVWNVNSTARGGGVAEMLRSLLAYSRGAGVDARWVVIEGDAEFFSITKRLHNRLHGSSGDGGPLGDPEHATYEATAAANADELTELVRPGDIALLHDPQTAGLVEPLRAAGVHVVWRVHIGLDLPNDLAREAWRFLLPYVRASDAYVFSRRAYAWEGLDTDRLAVIPPSIDPFSPKNQPMDGEAISAILGAIGLTERDGGRRTYVHHDGTPGRVDREAEVVQDAPIPGAAQLVTQVSRWDRLKDPFGVLAGFVEHVLPASDAHLLLAGPDVRAVADDPEGTEVMRAVTGSWEQLEPEARARVHLALLPMDDADENAAMVNAIQRHSAVVVQKSLAEGFGLTVAEGMWKGRPVVASRAGGISDQVIDGESGMLVDPSDLPAFGAAVSGVLNDPQRAAAMGATARLRVRDEFLGPRHLGQYVDLFESLIRDAVTA